MKTYGSFTEMAKDTKSVEPGVLDRLEAIGNNSHLNAFSAFRCRLW